MKNLISKYNISDIFYKRYFEQNALNRLSVTMLKFMWFREGKFLNPMKQKEHIENFIKEEIDNYYVKNELHIPQIEFCITTRCSLKCKDCWALIPMLDKAKRTDTSFAYFKEQLDKLLAVSDSIQLLTILGGEPLLCSELPQMLEYAASKDKIRMIKLITNGTILPQSNVLDVLATYKTRIFVYMSNYSDNPELTGVLKQDAIKALLAAHGVRLQKPENWAWMREKFFTENPQNNDMLEQKFLECERTKCNAIMNDRIDICSKATVARELGICEDDSVNLNSSDLRNDLIEFYQKPCMNACKYCIISTETVLPALQDGK